MSGTAALRVGFAGTPAFAAQALAALHEAGHALGPVLTQPDRPAGRGLKLQPSAVKLEAEARGLTVLQPRSLRLDGRWPDDAAATRAALQDAALDVLVVAAYGLILPAWVLALPRHGCLNIHASLLPRWRGAAPIQRAIEAGDVQTGVTIMQMDEGLDTGDMLLTATTPIDAEDTAASLLDRLAAQGAGLIVQALAHLSRGTLARTPQPREGALYAHKIDKAEATIDWSLPAPVIERRLRAFDPFPGAQTTIGDETFKIWRAHVVGSEPGPPPLHPGTVEALGPTAVRVACGEGTLALTALQVPGGRRIDAAGFLKTGTGRRLRPGDRLGLPPAEG